MARTVITKQSPPGSYAAAGALLTETAADVANGNEFIASGNDLLIVHNTGVSPYTWTLTGVADPMGRTGDIIAESIAAGAVRIFGPLHLTGWAQSDGSVHLDASNAAVKFAILSI